MAKDDSGSGECEVVVQADDWFSWIAGRCGMISDERCAICDNKIGVDVAHFLVVCLEFERDWQVLLDDVCKIVGGGGGGGGTVVGNLGE